MDNKRRACLVESDEEDEDGNLSEGDSNHSFIGSEPSMGDSDEEYVAENLLDDSSKSSVTSSEDEDEHLSENNPKSAKNKTVKDKTGSFNDDNVNTVKQSKSKIIKDKPTGNKINNNKVSKRKRQNSTCEENLDNCTTSSTDNVNETFNKQVPKRSKNLASEEGSDTSSSSVNNTVDMLKAKFARVPTPLCDAIVEEAEKNCEETDETQPTVGSKSNGTSKTLNSSDPNQMDLDKNPDSDNESKDLQTISKIDPLLVKKEEDDIKLEIKEDIDLIDEKKEDIKPFSMEEKPTDLVDIDECQALEDEHFKQGSKLTQSNVQNKKKGLKDPSFSVKTIKQSTLPHTTVSNQKDKTCKSSKALSKSDDAQTAVVPKNRGGRPSKYQALILAHRNKESENDHLFNLQRTENEDTNVGAPKSLPTLCNTPRKMVNQTGSGLQPVTSVVSFNSNNDQPIDPRKKLRPLKPKVAESSQRNKKQTVQNKNSHLQLPQKSPDSLVNSLLLIDNCITPSISQENVFEKNDLSCLQQLDNPANYSQNVQMTAKEKEFFIADYLISHQSVFDNSFFQNILPVLTEIIMLCMEEFTELLERKRKAEHFTSEKLRQQDVKLAVQSFCSMVSTYSEKFFPNLNSVMYKINQNKTKKGLIIAFIFFVANSLLVKAPKFKGQIHSIRKMLLCMYEIRKINSPLFLAVLKTPDNVFNAELKLLLKILLFLHKKKVLTIPTYALSEIAGIDSIEDKCELIVSLSTNCSRVNQELIKEEIFDHILCMLRQNHEVSSETPEKSNFESDPSHSLTQQDIGRILVESLEQDQLGGGLNSLFESYLKSTNNAQVDVKIELDDEDTALSLNTDLIFPVLAENIDNVIKVEEVDSLSLIPEIFEQNLDCDDPDPSSL